MAHWHTGTQGHRDTGTQANRHTGTQAHRHHTGTQAHRHTGTQAHRHHTGIQPHRYTGSQAHRLEMQRLVGVEWWDGGAPEPRTVHVGGRTITLRAARPDDCEGILVLIHDLAVFEKEVRYFIFRRVRFVQPMTVST